MKLILFILLLLFSKIRDSDEYINLGLPFLYIFSLYSSLKLSKLNNYKAKHFSFNVDGGRCENCKGEGNVKIEMQFMADVSLICENCKGKRFKNEILKVKYHKKSIDDILTMTCRSIARKRRRFFLTIHRRNIFHFSNHLSSNFII